MLSPEKTKKPLLLSVDPFDGEEHLVEEPLRRARLEPLALPPETEPPKLRRSESRALLAALGRQERTSLGRASLAELRERGRRALAWAEEHFERNKGPFVPFARSILQRTESEFRQFVPAADRQRERDDQERRDDALGSEAGLKRYLDHVDQVVRQHQAVGRFDWFPGYERGSKAAREEFRGHALVRMLEVVRSKRGFRPYEKAAKPGVEVTFVILSRLRAWIRRQRQISLVFAPEEAKVTLTPEDIVAEREAGRIRATAGPMVPRISRRLKQDRTRFWLKAMLADVADHGELDLTRVAEKVGKDRSSAWRAFQAIREAAREEWDELGFNEL